jgi:hypothetical protein
VITAAEVRHGCSHIIGWYEKLIEKVPDIDCSEFAFSLPLCSRQAMRRRISAGGR